MLNCLEACLRLNEMKPEVWLPMRRARPQQSPPSLPNRIKARPSQSKWRVHWTRGSWPFNNWVTTAFATDNCISGGCATLRLCTMCAPVLVTRSVANPSPHGWATPFSSFQPDVTFHRQQADAFRWPGPARRGPAGLTFAHRCLWVCWRYLWSLDCHHDDDYDDHDHVDVVRQLLRHKKKYIWNKS